MRPAIAAAALGALALARQDSPGAGDPRSTRSEAYR